MHSAKIQVHARLFLDMTGLSTLSEICWSLIFLLSNSVQVFSRRNFMMPVNYLI